MYRVRKVHGRRAPGSPHMSPPPPAVTGLLLSEGQRSRVRGKGECGQQDSQGRGNVS